MEWVIVGFSILLVLVSVALLVSVIIFARSITKENKEFATWLETRSAELKHAGGGAGPSNMEMIRKANERNN
jgi:hypothetical protein